MLGPSTSGVVLPGCPQSTSTPKKSDRKGSSDKGRSQSVTSGENHKYTTLKSAKKSAAKEAAKKSVEEKPEPDHSSKEEEEEEEEEEEYEFLEEGDEQAFEQPQAQVVICESDVREDLAVPALNEEPGPFWHVTVPPGKRHLIPVLVGTQGTSLSWKFSTEKRVN